MTSEHGFRLPASPGMWCSHLQQEHPDLQVRILGIFPAADGDIIETIEVRGAGADRAIETIRFSESARSFDIIYQAADHCTLRVKTSACEGCRVAATLRVSPTFPLRLDREGCHWRILATSGIGRAISERLSERYPGRVSLESKRNLREKTVLTARQRDILAAAIREGYYARPRRVTLSGLASRLGVRKSTLSQSLATIEAKILPNHHEPAVRGGLGE